MAERKTGRGNSRLADGAAPKAEPRRRLRLADLPVDRYRAFVFPNRIREARRRAGFPRLLQLSQKINNIPYIRLSKIERGEVFARPIEIVSVAQALSVRPEDLLIEVDTPDFDIASWAEPFAEDADAADTDEERLALVLGAAVRGLRAEDRALTIATIERQYGIPPVILSRIENAQKPLTRWNRATLASLCALFRVDDESALRALVVERYAQGRLNAFIGTIATAAERRQRSAERIGALRAALASVEIGEDTPPEPEGEHHETHPAAAPARRLPVLGAPLADGLIAPVSTNYAVEAPGAAGPRAFGLKVFRATLGGGLPGQATVVVDPDRYPIAGGLAAVREPEGFRLMTVTLDRSGAMIGSSLVPDREVPLDTLAPDDVAAVIAAYFI